MTPPRQGWGPGVAPDSPLAYDSKALWVTLRAAAGLDCGTDSYPADVADAVLDAVGWAADELGRFTVQRC